MQKAIYFKWITSLWIMWITLLFSTLFNKKRQNFQNQIVDNLNPQIHNRESPVNMRSYNPIIKHIHNKFNTYSQSYPHHVKLWITLWKSCGLYVDNFFGKKIRNNRLTERHKIYIIGVVFYDIKKRIIKFIQNYKEVPRLWKWHFSQKKDRDPKFTVSEKEWALLTVEKY